MINTARSISFTKEELRDLLSKYKPKQAEKKAMSPNKDLRELKEAFHTLLLVDF